MKKRKILFLGETFRADAITWMKGLQEFGNFEIISWELKTPSNGFLNKSKRIFEFCLAYFKIKSIIKTQNPDMIIAERTTSYGFLAAISGLKPIAIAQQGKTDLWPEDSILIPFKKIIQNYAFKKANLIHAWGQTMTFSMVKAKVDFDKVLILPKGINLSKFEAKNNANVHKISAIVTRSLELEYRHDVILKAFSILKQKNIQFELLIVGEGSQRLNLEKLANHLNIQNHVRFCGKIANDNLPNLLQKSNIYISMPITEGVSASLFEAMASGCYPIVSDVLGNQIFIENKKNGMLIPIDDFQSLGDAIIWAFQNHENRSNAIVENRKYVVTHANYELNMKIISNEYHKLISDSKNKSLCVE